MLNKEQTEKIFLYRVKLNGKKKEYIWYGEYKIVGENETRQHIGKDGVLRNIIVISLQKIHF